MNAKELIKNGYKEFTPSEFFTSSKKGFQKKVCDEKGEKYFITIYYFDKLPNHNHSESFEISLQFNKMFKKKEYTFNINVFSFYTWDNETEIKTFHPLNEIEELIEEVYKKNKFEYYDKY